MDEGVIKGLYIPYSYMLANLNDDDIRAIYGLATYINDILSFDHRIPTPLEVETYIYVANNKHPGFLTDLIYLLAAIIEMMEVLDPFYSRGYLTPKKVAI